jgi:hypothetical protein
MKRLDEKIRDVYEILETLNEAKREKIDIFSRDEDIMTEELEKMRFTYFKKGFLACLLYVEEDSVLK